MPSDDKRGRTDSVADHLASVHARTRVVIPEATYQATAEEPQQAQQATVRKGSYSLYPNCTPTSPHSPPLNRMPAPLPFRSNSSSTQRSTIRPTSQGNDRATPIDASGEPLVEDFESNLISSPIRSMRGGFLPGLSNEAPTVPPRGASVDAVTSRDFGGTRQLKSVTKHPTLENQHRRSRSDLDGFGSSTPTSPDMRQGSSEISFSEASTAPSEPPLVPLQTHGLQNDDDQMYTISADDPKNFDLIAAGPEDTRNAYSIEDRADRLVSIDHLRQIFADPRLLLHFTGFLNSHRPKSVRTLIYYLDALKAIRAIKYANAITEGLDPLHGHDFASSAPPPTVNKLLEERAQKAFEVLAHDDLPAYVAYTWIQVVSESVQKRVTGTLAPHLREASEGLAEVFCLSDPSRPDNPIVFASEEFQRTTQYGMNYSVGRNCRFLQGPRTSARSVQRLREAITAGKEHSEVLLNYRRDGSPFMNLLMMAPLHDSQGTIRYFIGAQVDVSGLVRDATDLEGLRRLIRRDDDPEYAQQQDKAAQKDDFEALAEMLNRGELEAVRKHGGHMHRSHFDDAVDADDDSSDRGSIRSSRPRLLLTDPTTDALDRSTADLPRETAKEIKEDIRASGRLQGVYQHYLLLRPAPSLRILFTSPSLRIPGILQTPFLNRVGGSTRVRNELAAAFAEGCGVTAKIRWLTRPEVDDTEGRARWIHATPLLNHRGEIGVWMVVLVDEGVGPGGGLRRFRNPPVIPAGGAMLSDGYPSIRGYGGNGGGATTTLKHRRAAELAQQGRTAASTSILATEGGPMGSNGMANSRMAGDVGGQRYDVSRRPRTRDKLDGNKRAGVVSSFFDDQEEQESGSYGATWADRVERRKLTKDPRSP